MIGKCIVVAVVAIYAEMQLVDAAQERTTYSINHYDIDISAGYRIGHLERPVDDFDLYEVRPLGRNSPRLLLYFGNHPRFPRLKWSTAAVVASKDGETTKTYSFSEKYPQIEGLMTFDGLTYKDSGASPFTCVHYFATGLTDATARAFDEIVKSIRVSKRHLD